MSLIKSSQSLSYLVMPPITSLTIINYPLNAISDNRYFQGAVSKY